MNKKKIQLKVVLSLALLLSSCAPTVTVVNVPQKGPEISKALLNDSFKGLKRKVAIAKFTNDTKHGKSIFSSNGNDQVGSQASSILSAKLASTEKFLLLDREIQDISRLESGNSDSMKVNADYLIVGSVTAFGRKTTSDVGVFSRNMKQIVNASVNIRLIDVYTGEIVYSEEGSGESASESSTSLGTGTTSGYDASLDDRAITAAISKLVNNVIQNLLDKPWRAYIIDEQEGNYIISGGKSQGVRVGDIYDVIEKGKKIKNPQTGLLIEMPGKKVTELKIISTVGENSNEISICQTVNSNKLEKSFNDYYIQERK